MNQEFENNQFETEDEITAQPAAQTAVPPTRQQLKKTARSFYGSAGRGFLLYYALAYGISFGVGSVMGALGVDHMSSAFINGFNCVVSLLVNLLAFELYRRRQKISIKSFTSLENVRIGDILDGTVTVMGFNGFISIAMSLVLGLLSELTGANPSTPDFSLVGDFWADFWMVVSVIIVAPFMEEYIFRGLLQTGFKRYGRAFSIIAPAVLFGLLHGNVIQAIPAMAIGVILGYFTDKTGSIATSVCIHMLNNLLAMLFSLPGVPVYASTVVILICMGLTVLMMVFGKKGTFPKNHPEIPKYLRWGTLITAPSMIITFGIFVIENISSLI